MQTEAPDRLRIYEYSRENLDALLVLFKKHPSYINDSNIQEKDVPSIKRLLIRNGILEETFHTNRNYTRYVIPYLYRNFFKVGRPD